MTRWALALIGLGLALVACSDAGRGEAPEPTTRQWELESGALDGAPVPIVAGHPITLSFTDTEAGGTAACNGYSGPYTISGAELTFAPPAVTEMACSPEQVMESEATYLEALVRVSNFAVETGVLTLTGEGVELVFAEVPPAPDADLTGTVWVLDSLVLGDAVSTEMGERATLELFTDGSLLGSTGCRTISGSYELDGTSVLVTGFSAHGECSEALAGQDALVMSVLSDEFGVVIEGDTLTVQGDGDEGLVYKAET
jgi:heat shock protein HslJ